jgi:hypothetical protein
LAISEHGLKEEEITQCALKGYTVAWHFCRKEYKGGGIAIYSSCNITQHKPLKWVKKKDRKNHWGYWHWTNMWKEKNNNYCII